ncbi:MAG: DUF2147 domain-containing protein [Verrucomicrobia bacterium]|jgi:uncharacterized protein (DUF2147 family)|nr:DUF2147 domain-containing protein [Verrucomicrobiota bacterium]
MRTVLDRAFSLLCLVCWLPLAGFAAAGVEGKWRTIDDESGRAKSVVDIAMTPDGLQGRVVKILHSDRGPNPLCEKCPGERRGEPVTGMVILWGLRKDKDGSWSGGRILDPTNGKIYKAKLRLQEDGRLAVRGFIGFSLLGRTQVWEPLE